MIDRNDNIIPQNTLFKRYYRFIKENTAQIAIILPIVVAIYGAVYDYYFYIVTCGYYKYFRIDDNLMLPCNRINLYQNIRQLALIGAYWGFSMFAVRMLKLKRNYLWKCLSWILIPLLLNSVIAYVWNLNVPLIVVSVMLLPAQWGMLFALGYCMVVPFHQETLSKPKRTNRKKKMIECWGDKEYKLLGILLILVACIMIFWQGYFTSYTTASEKRRFGIVEIDEEQYVVIDANGDKMILQKCEINQNVLKINYNTYLCVNNEMIINFETFDNVELTKD